MQTIARRRASYVNTRSAAFTVSAAPPRALPLADALPPGEQKQLSTMDYELSTGRVFFGLELDRAAFPQALDLAM